MGNFLNLKVKVVKYLEVRENAKSYRKVWNEELRETIVNELKKIIAQINLPAEIEIKEQLKNLEAIALTLGREESGIYEELSNNVKRRFIKYNGMLVFQQLFNGKIMISIMYPFIEGLAKPKPPKTVEIIRPEEFKTAFLERYMDIFLKEITEWEDYDDDIPHKIGFQTNFQQSGVVDESDVAAREDS